MRTIPRCFELALVMILMLSIPASSAAQVSVGIAVAFAPPDLPVYEQPICPAAGYIWTPGYWAYDPDFGDYYWVPGTWVPAPEIGFLWTPGYWAWGGSGFIFYEGFWGPVVGFYGGVNYGYGYFGHGYAGGRWDGGQFFYNRSVTNVNVTVIHNVYNTTVTNNTNVTRVSYNGGSGGINERPTPQEEAAAHAKRLPPVPVQRQHVQAARSDPQLRASVNRGKPPIAATPKPGAFKEHGVVHAREGGALHNAPNSASNAPRRNAAVHPNELPRPERPGALNTGNPKLDHRYQQQQEKLYAQQGKERQRLQQQQEKEHQQLARQHADEARRQQVEQRHQQQTEQLQQRHSQQQQRLQERQPEARPTPPREKQEKH